MERINHFIKVFGNNLVIRKSATSENQYRNDIP